MILLIDNYDSFVYNLARYVLELGFSYQVVRNDKITVKQIADLKPSHIIISPGPCTPDQAGVSLDVIKYFANQIPILGVCLGHQAIGQAFGAKVVRAKHPMHGKASKIFHNEEGIFSQLENPLCVGRYHSLIVSEKDFPKELIITAHSNQDEIMGIKHVVHNVFGVQFHPESILTHQGHDLLRNFLLVYSSTLNPILSK